MLSVDEEKSLHDSNVDIVKQFLLDTLQKKSKGDRYSYDELVRQLRKRDDTETLWRVYVGLSTYVAMMMKRFDIISIFVIS